ncbi:hypothetical protein SALBM135S_08392 [Streptomyces alboniger]
MTVTASSAGARKAVGRFDELLRQGDRARATHRHLLAGQRSAGLLMDGRPLTDVLRPRLIVASERARQCADGSLVTRAICRLAAHASRPDALGALVRHHLALTPREWELVASMSPLGDLVPHSRLDGFETAEGMRFVEFNAHPSGGVISAELLADCYLSAEVMQEFSREYTIRHVPARTRLARSLVSAWHEAGAPGGAPHVAIVDWSGLDWEFAALRREFRRLGVPAVVCSPDDLAYERGRGLFTRAADRKGRPVTVVYRRAVFNDLLARYGRTLRDHPMTRASADGACVMINPYAGELVNRKSVLALLTDRRVTESLPAPEAAAARALVPWTRFVREGVTTSPDEREVDLMRFARDHRAGLVLKPNDDYGGKGVLCGWQATDTAWRAALAKAVVVPHVIQERVPIPTVHYPVLSGGQVHTVPYGESTDPYLFGTDSPGCITRLSTSALLNVSAGGAAIPDFCVEPRLRPGLSG